MDAQTAAPTSPTSPATGPLVGLRVLELAQLLAGPYSGQLLADLGADVIKVEQPGVGDPMREWGREKADGRSLWWPIVARNKRSITLDLRVEEGQELIRRLVADTDILIENFRPGTLERWNLRYEDLAEINPRLIMVRVTGYGQDGPYSSKAGYGSIGEAMGGLRHVTGDPSTPPSRAGISIGDTLAAVFATVGALSALHARERTGRGQIVDSAIYEAVLAVMESLIPEYEVAGLIRERTGSFLPNIAPSNLYPTSDGTSYLIAANQDTVFRRLAVAMERPELADDPRYATHSARGAHQQELDELIASWSATMSAADLAALLDEHGVPAGPIFRAPEMLADPHFAAREAIITLPDANLGAISMQNVFPRLSETPGTVRWTGPELGQHTAEVLGALGLGAADLERLRAQGVI
jgi:formyl-CoA transferase